MAFTFLVATLLALAAGPVLYGTASRSARALKVLDGFVLVSIVGLVAVEVAPDALRAGGPWSVAFLLAGLFGPTLLERLFHRADLHRVEHQMHVGTLLLAIGGLVLHALADGVVLAPGAGSDWALSAAVVIHSLPVGMAVWFLLGPHFGARLAGLALLGMGAGTVAGFAWGVPLSAMLGAQAWAWFQALVAGTLLHVVFGRPHLHAAGHGHG